MGVESDAESKSKREKRFNVLYKVTGPNMGEALNTGANKPKTLVTKPGQ
jgi:hypothetical protein